MQSIDGETIDFSEGKQPDLRKAKKLSVIRDVDDLSVSDSNEPTGTNRGTGTGRRLMTTEDRAEKERQLRRVRIAQMNVDDREEIDPDKMKYHQRFAPAFDNQLIFSQKDKKQKIDIPREERSENDVYDNVNTSPVLEMTPTNLKVERKSFEQNQVIQNRKGLPPLLVNKSIEKSMLSNKKGKKKTKQQREWEEKGLSWDKYKDEQNAKKFEKHMNEEDQRKA